MIVDSEAVKAKAHAFVGEKNNGLASFEKIELFWFPRPGVEFRDAAISFDKEIQGKIQQLTLYPSIRLLTGNLAFSSITADGATWIVRLPTRDDKPFNLGEVEEKVRAAVTALASSFPAMNLRIHRGTAILPSPAALGAEIVNVTLRILKLPLGALQIFTPSQPGLEKK